jgi:uncharacterized glyoxalase superfamily protein PhnB
MKTNRSIPRASVIPELPYSNIGEAIDWLCAAFGFTLRLRIADHRAQLTYGEGALVLIEAGGEIGKCAVMVRVEDARSHCENARKHGATITREPADYPYGERQYNAVDLAGHRWTFSESIADVDPREWGGTPGEL